MESPKRSLYPTMRFAEVFPDPETVTALVVTIELTLQRKIAGMLHERTVTATAHARQQISPAPGKRKTLGTGEKTR